MSDVILYPVFLMSEETLHPVFLISEVTLYPVTGADGAREPGGSAARARRS